MVHRPVCPNVLPADCCAQGVQGITHPFSERRATDLDKNMLSPEGGWIEHDHDGKLEGVVTRLKTCSGEAAIRAVTDSRIAMTFLHRLLLESRNLCRLAKAFRWWAGSPSEVVRSP
jgi:hypothetical protein